MTDLSGLRVLVVEDESLVLLNLEDSLESLGCRIVGPAMRVPHARALVEGGEPPDIAILDVNVAGEPVFPVAEKLEARGVPILFATGYGRDGLPPPWNSRPVLQKPYGPRDIAAALTRLAQSRHTGRHE
jgi:CheY-like chemotaxis protein